MAVLLDEANPDKPWGGLPKPALVVTGLGDRSADVLADFSGAVRIPLEGALGLATPWGSRPMACTDCTSSQQAD